MPKPEVVKELRDGVLLFLGTLVLGTLLIGTLVGGLFILGERLEHQRRVQEGCLSDDGRDMQLCGGSDDSGFAR